jgi:biopolymer transport protein ExbD
LNLTPMIDVVFLLIFFFLTVSRFGAVEGMLPARLPARPSAGATAVPRTPLYVRMVAPAEADGLCRVTIDRFQVTPILLAELPAKLSSIRREVPGFDRGTRVILVAGAEIPWDDVVNAYNAAIAAEYRKVLFAAEDAAAGEG